MEKERTRWPSGQHRFESEGRSHAYNAAIEADGSGIMGVPTVKRIMEAGRWAWRSRLSISRLLISVRSSVSSRFVRSPLRSASCTSACMYASVARVLPPVAYVPE